MILREAIKFAALPVLGSAVAFALNAPAAGVVLGVLAGFVVFFFRDPERAVPAHPAAVVAPADGRVVRLVEESHFDRAGRRLSIFLSLWDVHVNRAPVEGRILHIQYRPGRFRMAFRDAASEENEQNIVHLETPRGPVILWQIAGWVARRVVLWKGPGETVSRGERLGMIRFGSRVDLWLPEEAQIVVRVGEHVRAGSTVVAYWQ